MAFLDRRKQLHGADETDSVPYFSGFYFLSVLISAPLEQYSPSGRGEIYKCTDTCTKLPFAGRRLITSPEKDQKNRYFDTKHSYHMSFVTQMFNVFYAAPEFAVNMSLGLTMTKDPESQNTMVSCKTSQISRT